ncbi:hypothetical protein [Photorhabdus laumondii]|nr:hypothetical protein [Photorhabdus laumondii]
MPAVLWQRQHIALHRYSLLFVPEPYRIPDDIYLGQQNGGWYHPNN